MQSSGPIWIFGAGGMIGTALSSTAKTEALQQVRFRHRQGTITEVLETDDGFEVWIDLHSERSWEWLGNDKNLPSPSSTILLSWGDRRNPNAPSHTTSSPRFVRQMAKVSIDRGARKVIFAGSIDEYGNHDGARIETVDLPTAINNYAAGKILVKNELERLCELRDVNYIHCRISNVYGPTQVTDSLIQILWRAHLDKTKPRLGSCDAWRDHVYVEDVSRAIFALLGSQLRGVFNIGSGMPTQVMELAKILWSSFGESPSDIYFRKKDPSLSQMASPGWALDISLIEQKTGWRPEFDLDSGCRATAKNLSLQMFPDDDVGRSGA